MGLSSIHNRAAGRWAVLACHKDSLKWLALKWLQILKIEGLGICGSVNTRLDGLQYIQPISKRLSFLPLSGI